MTDYSASLNVYETNAGMPGAAPNGVLMQGNPVPPSAILPQQNLPGNQNTPTQLMPTQVSNGNISANSIPVNVLTAPGTDSLMAQMSRGQVIKKDSTYGIAQFTPANGGAGPNINTVGAVPQPVATGPASALTYPAPGSQNHLGN